MQEILVVAVIALAIFFLPRLLNRKAEARPPEPKRISDSYRFLMGLTGWMRLAILVTFLWVVGCAAYLKPWAGNTFLFYSVSLGPALALWGGVWVWYGYKRYRR